MAETETGQERTEQATPKRREEARRKGQIPRSRELNTLAMTLSSAVALVVMGDYLMEHFGDLLRQGLMLDRRLIFDPHGALEALGRALAAGLVMLVPFFALNLVVAVLSSISLGGWSFSTEALAPKLSKMSPLKGLKRMFALRGLMELGKALAKFLLVGAVGTALLWHYAGEMLALGYQSVEQALAHSGDILAWSFVFLSLTLVIVAAVDVPFQLWDHGRNLKMTRQEVKDEMKDTEGKPEVKSRIRQLQREMARQRMMEAVPEADVVITNPTHFAVALKYDQANMRAPRVVAKGADLIAARIRELAMEHEVPIFSAPPLARALYHSTDIDQEIPAGLYLAVAQVLAYVYQLKTMARHGGAAPEAPSDFDIPEEYRK